MLNDQLPIIGYDNKPFPHSFVRQERETDHLAILLPGFAYGPDRPALYYPALLLTDMGADALRLGRLYSEIPGFQEMPESERARIIVTDALSACEVGLKQRNYSRITLVGKSIGTLAMARLLKLHPKLARADCIWLTPLLDNVRMRESIIEKRPRSLFVIGTADRFYDASLLSELEKATGGKSLVIEGANHSLELEGQVSESIQIMEEIMAVIEEFVIGEA